MAKIEYKTIISQKAKARFGELVTGKGSFKLPYISPAIRTHRDCGALLENIKNGLYPQVITPYASCRSSVMSDLKDILGLSYETTSATGYVRPETLIIPDPEYEAISFNCIARKNFIILGSIDKNYRSLFKTALTSSKNTDSRIKVEKAWRDITKNYGYTGITDWATSILEGVESDIFLAPTPIVRGTEDSVLNAFGHGYNILDEAMSENKFNIYGIHFLFHWNLFLESNENSSKARKKIYDMLDTWHTANRDRYSSLVFSFKIRDNNHKLSDQNSGSARRQILSDFISEISERIRRANGMVIAHNFGNWSLGIIDSGSDISTFRITGPTRIDVPIIIRRGTGIGKNETVSMPYKGPKEIPSIFSPDTLTEWDIERVKKMWTDYHAYPVPSCVEPEPYWTWDNYNKKVIYCGRTRCGSLVELGEEYREVGVNVEGIPLNEALRNRIKQSDIDQELKDLCPSLRNYNFGSY